MFGKFPLRFIKETLAFLQGPVREVNYSLRLSQKANNVRTRAEKQIQEINSAARAKNIFEEFIKN